MDEELGEGSICPSCGVGKLYIYGPKHSIEFLVCSYEVYPIAFRKIK